MNDLERVWRFTRMRLAQAIDGLSDEGLNWRQHKGSHTIGEILYHIAGAEHYWATRLCRRDPSATEFQDKLDSAIHDGFLRNGSSPFKESEMALDRCLAALEFTELEIWPVLGNPSPDQLEMKLTSPVGDVINGREGLTRLAQHAGYHTGQIWMIRMHPDFPE